MTMTADQLQAAAEALVEAEQTGQWTEPVSNRHEDATVEDAYRIGLGVRDLKLAAGRTVKGHKIGFTSKAMRSLVGATEPDYGFLFDDWFVPEGSVVPRGRMNRPLVEQEIAFVMGATLKGPSVHAADVIRATDFVLPALEIVDSRYSGRGKTMLVDSISDAASCGFVVLGGNPARLTDIDVRRVSGSLSINGDIMETGTAAGGDGQPGERRRLAGQQARRVRRRHGTGRRDPVRLVHQGRPVRRRRLGAGDVRPTRRGVADGRPMMLPHRPLGASGIDVSIMSLGSWRTYERMSRDDGLAVMHAARDAGIDFLDDARYDDETGTAPIRTGWSEVVFGELFRASGWRRDDVTISNKLWWEHWPDEDAVTELDGSLGRMELDHVDLIYAIAPPKTLPVATVVEQVAGLIASGRARAWGSRDVVRRAARRSPRRLRRDRRAATRRRADGLQPRRAPPSERPDDPRRSSTAARSASSPPTSSPAGRCSGKYLDDANAPGRAGGDDNPVARRGKEIAARLAELGGEWGLPTAHLAIAYALGHPNLASILFGATSPEQVRNNVAAVATFDALDTDQRAAIDDLA